jgi:hypothetical protein
MNSVIDVPVSELIKNSAESKLLNINWACDGVVIYSCVPDLCDNIGVDFPHPIVRICIKTEYIFLRSPCVFNNIHSCFFNVIDVSKVMDTNEWGFYIPACDKKNFFEQRKKSLTLAYGKHSSKYKLLFEIKPNIFQALLCNIDDIKCHIIDYLCPGVLESVQNPEAGVEH